MTIRGGGNPKQTMVLAPVSRMGPPPRSFAADAHGCIMVRFVMDLPDTRLRREFLVPDSELPSDASSRPQRACRRARVYQGAAWKRWSVSQRGATAGLDSPCARRLPIPMGRGEETGFQIEQRNWDEESEECRRIVLDFGSLARRSLALRPAHSRCHQFVTRIPKASAISSPPQLLRLLAAGAVAGWALHPLESAAWHGARQKRTSDDMAAEGGSSLLEGKPSSKSCKYCTGGCLDCAAYMRAAKQFSEATEKQNHD